MDQPLTRVSRLEPMLPRPTAQWAEFEMTPINIYEITCWDRELACRERIKELAGDIYEQAVAQVIATDTPHNYERILSAAQQAAALLDQFNQEAL